MIASSEGDQDWSEEKMEWHCDIGCLREKKIKEDDVLRTIGSLRARLLAERQASRVAKENEELMSKKLIELESKLKEETKLRSKAERRLELLKKKLESLSISSISGESELSCSTEKSGDCSLISLISSSASKHQQQNQFKSHASNTQHLSSQDPNDSISNLNPVPQDSKTEENRSSSSNSWVEENCVDNSMALVPVTHQKAVMDDTKDCDYNPFAIVPSNLKRTGSDSQPKAAEKKSVIQVLDALRHAREKLLVSMETRHMIKVGPA